MLITGWQQLQGIDRLQQQILASLGSCPASDSSTRTQLHQHLHQLDERKRELLHQCDQPKPAGIMLHKEFINSFCLQCACCSPRASPSSPSTSHLTSGRCLSHPCGACSCSCAVQRNGFIPLSTNDPLVAICANSFASIHHEWWACTIC